jgi:hypothetical protein
LATAEFSGRPETIMSHSEQRTSTSVVSLAGIEPFRPSRRFSRPAELAGNGGQCATALLAFPATVALWNL